MISIDPQVQEELVAKISGNLQMMLVGKNKRISHPHIASIVEAAVDDVFNTCCVAENKEVNILLSDLRGFTAMSENYPAITVMKILNGYFEIMCPIIVRYGGTIDKLMGDSIMALFGAPDSQSDDLERTLACAVEMQLAMGELNEKNNELGYPSLYMGIGINTGAVVAGELGADAYSEYTVIGNEVNLASRIEAHSLRGQVLISENTYNLAKNYISVGEASEVHLKGKNEPVKLYELISTARPMLLISPNVNARKGPRVEVDMPMNFHCISGKVVDPLVNCGRITDISYGGFQSIMPLELEPFSEVRLTLSLSLLSERSKDVYAKVLRKEPFQDEYRYSMEFTSIDPVSQRTLNQFVDNMVSI